MPKEHIYLKFWGVRGSLPTTGKAVLKYGGNTSCLEIRAGEKIIIFDAGSGIKELGDNLLPEMPIKANIFFTHYHWDHIMGFPFFTPLFIPGNEFAIYGETKDGISVKQVLEGQMVFPYFPVKLSEIARAKLTFKAIKPDMKVKIGDVVVQAHRLKHPQAALGYSVTYRGSKFTHITDVEHDPNFQPALIKFCKDADVMTYDSAYTPKEYESKKNWGHSTWLEACKIAKAAKVKKLFIFHHDPSHSDTFLEEEVLKPAKKEFKGAELARDRLEVWF